MGKARQAPRRTLRSGPGREALPAGYHRVPASEGLGPVRGQRLATHRPLLLGHGSRFDRGVPGSVGSHDLRRDDVGRLLPNTCCVFAHKRNRTLTIRPKRRRPRTVRLT